MKIKTNLITKLINAEQARSLVKELIAKMSPNATLPIAVPTVTVLAVHPEDPFKVSVMKHQPTKHNGRRTLIGGKFKLRGTTTPLQQAHTEWAEEAGGEGATLENVELWAIKLDHNADVRQVPLKKSTDGDCPSWLEGVTTTAYFGTPDRIYTATVKGTPAPVTGEGEDLAESVKCEWVDVRSIQLTCEAHQSSYGAQHDLIMKVYCHVLEGRWVLKPGDFEDFEALRDRLLEIQCDDFIHAVRCFQTC